MDATTFVTRTSFVSDAVSDGGVRVSRKSSRDGSFPVVGTSAVTRHTCCNAVHHRRFEGLIEDRP